MARYVASVRTDWEPAAAFAYLADLRHFAEWDPGVQQVVQVEGDGGGPDTTFDVTVAAVGRDLTLRYRTTEHHEPDRFTVIAHSAALTSTDTITVAEHDGQTVVTYDACLELNGVLRFAGPLLSLAFDRIGRKAEAGLREALQGERTS